MTNLIRQDFIPLGHTSHEQSPKSNLKGDLSEDNGLKLKYCVWTTQLQRLSLGVLRSHLIRVSFIWFQRIVCVCAGYFKQQHNRIIQHMLRIFSGDLAFFGYSGSYMYMKLLCWNRFPTCNLFLQNINFWSPISFKHLFIIYRLANILRKILHSYMKYGVIRLSSPINFIASVKLVNERWSKYSWNVFLELTRSGSKKSHACGAFMNAVFKRS